MNVSGVNVQSKSGVKWRKNTTLRVRGERSLRKQPPVRETRIRAKKGTEGGHIGGH